jgi:shikimate kinase
METRKRNIALIGFRATGKSVIGRLLAQKHGRPFVDMDESLVNSFGEEILSWVQIHGWESFRKAESDLLNRLSLQTELIVATGGGVVISPDNRRTLRKGFFVIWLQASPETIHHRLTKDPKSESFRPPLTQLPLKEEIEQLLSQRRAWYQESADLILETDLLPPQALVERIEESIENKVLDSNQRNGM